ncbi:MAG: type II toxin-antitoxin system HicA family toxin [Thermoanaerobacteraceae bacterium]|nr:type II toxin-antitoxin system HicA family toxin [Thermoanaerobacteraceae bacterium]
MSTLKKLYRKIRSNPNQVRFNELRRLLLRAGFKERRPRNGSSHYTYTKGDKIITIVKHDNPVKAIYVKLAIKALEGELPDE